MSRAFSWAGMQAEDRVSSDVRRIYDNPIGPLAVAEQAQTKNRINFNVASGDEQQYLAAATLNGTGLRANTPSPKPSGSSEESRTPHSSFSSTTVVEPPCTIGCKMPNFEDGSGLGPEQDIPLALKSYFWGPLVFAMAAIAIAFEALYWKGKPHHGWLASPDLANPLRIQSHIVLSSVPSAVAAVIMWLYSMVNDEVYRLQPLINLSKSSDEDADAKATLFLDYDHRLFWHLCRARKDWMCLLCILMWMISTFVLLPLSGSLFNVQDVWWLYPPVNATGTSQISASVGNNFLDMIAFQGASGYATARVLFNVGPVPFVTDDGYTLEEFELPTNINGTAYASVGAVFNQATCVSPSNFEMDQDVGTEVFHNTAWFADGCMFSWTVNNESTNIFGVDTLPDLAQCNNYTGVALEHRPVVFWFFSYNPVPIFSVVQCTPQVTVSHVSAAIELSTNSSSVQSAGDPGSSTIGDLNHPAYNGLFFDETLLDSEALMRLKSIQQQLPSAVFEAAKLKDPTLVHTFVYYGFTSITQDIYNTYLSVIAKSIYFVDSQEPVSIRVASYCKRVFLSSITTHAFVACAVVLGVFGFVVEVGHFHTRKNVNIPRRFGTIGTAIALGASSEVQYVLNNAFRQKDIVAALDDCRFSLDPKTHRVAMRRVTPGPLRKSRTCWLMNIPRYIKGVVVKKPVRTVEAFPLGALEGC